MEGYEEMPAAYPGPFVSFASSPWEEIASLGIRRSFPAQTTILHPGDQARGLYFIHKGEILVTHFFSPEDSFKLYIIGAKAMAGIAEMFAPVPPRASWHTLSPCVCSLFSREQVDSIVSKAMLLKLIEQTSFMSITMAERFSQGGCKRNDVRLARFLLHFAAASAGTGSPEKGGVTVIPNISQKIASELIGMHPVTFNKLLAAFRKQGIVGKSKRSCLEILDTAALARFAEGTMPTIQSHDPTITY